MTAYPKLRLLETTWVKHNGQTALMLRDKLGLTDNAVLVPAALAVLLSFFDGTRDEAALRAIFELRTGLHLDPLMVHQFISQLDETLMLEGPRAEAALREALAQYRRAPFRPPALAGQGYANDPTQLTAELDQYWPNGDGVDGGRASSVRGLISPHIDFLRGGPTYGKIWQRATLAAQAAEVVVIFGTDHFGGALLTPTRQNYATPWGVLPTATWAVDALAEALDGKALFGAELNHRNEHSIEQAVVWLHYVLGGRPVEVVPVLCGSFQHFTDGEADPAEDQQLAVAVQTLREVIGRRRHLVVAAADLAHVGPAFGDDASLGPAEKAKLSEADAMLLEAACTGEAEAFFAPLREEQDCRRVCGLPPIYMMLRLLGRAKGEVVDYDQCSADAEGGSIVSIAGVVYC